MRSPAVLSAVRTPIGSAVMGNLRGVVALCADSGMGSATVVGVG